MAEERKRVVVEHVKPQVDFGRFPVKRVVGDHVIVEADVFAEGHDLLNCVVLFRRAKEDPWSEAPMEPLSNDHWRGRFRVEERGRYRYTVLAWVDRFLSWRRDLEKKFEAGQDVAVDLLVGAELVEETAKSAPSPESESLMNYIELLRSDKSQRERVHAAVDEPLAVSMVKFSPRRYATKYGRELEVVVDEKKARFSAWYEMFPRSCAPEPGRHGTLADCEKRLEYIAEMGFDVVYLPPVHPIGMTHRKGKNNSTDPAPDDVGSPWAIGSEDGGHKSVHPDLGTIEDFRHFVSRAGDYGIDVAIDIAIQCSPDHPYVKDHPEWFRWRPDGKVQYAENPPKKYEDIYPLNFDTDNWQELWNELKSVFLFWIENGVRIFRVDNPHTKPFRFWEWLIEEVKRDYPETIFLSEAFTRPKVMHYLAKVGFTQSYTYFTWRNTKWELTDYARELTATESREYLRPNLWPNTPDVLTEYLQIGGRPAFIIRLVLAATMGASYGIYGPAFELCETRALKPGSEEYMDSEKYEIRDWDLDAAHSLKDVIGRMNRIRKENRALQEDWNLRHHSIDNDQMICYSKHTENLDDVLLVIVNLDPYHTQSGWVELPLSEFGLDERNPYQMHDLLSEARFLWYGPRNYVELDPQAIPAHILRIRRKVRTEKDFDYYL
ncbi:MAG: alpha-1,4-glucan--maltose-1-phosphate maltosyltransferase [bacterium]